MSTLSLLDYFDPPEGYTGYFGLVCGYDAQESCAENMVRHFADQGLYQGSQVLAFMIDRGSSFRSCPEKGWLRLYPRELERPFKILHAKVALLVFRDLSCDARWCTRLLVCTGNWTEQTVRRNLDLMWSTEATLSPRGTVKGDDTETTTDVQAAWKFMQYLCKLHDLTPLLAIAGRQSENAVRWQQFRAVLDQIRGKDRITPRFMDNRNASFLNQLSAHITPHRRNYLGMGSGFFESNTGDRVPEVLERIVEILHESSFLLRNAWVDLFVNRNACQGIASSKEAIKQNGWHIWPAADPLERDRFLHAKFLFSAYEGEENRSLTYPWVYLGSGNLTHHGFLEKASAAGNLETGVVFEPVLRCQIRGDDRCILQYLPIGWPDEEPDDLLLSPGEAFQMHEPCPVPPVSLLLWKPGQLCFAPSDDTPRVPCYPLDPTGAACKENNQAFVWPYDRPSKVTLCWQEDDTAFQEVIPVMDEYGNLGSDFPAPASVAEALSRLKDFPFVPEEDEKQHTGDGPDNGDKSETPTTKERQGGHPSEYGSIRPVMRLVEAIGRRQLTLTETGWLRWCNTLEQTLVAMKELPEMIQLRKDFSVNPLSMLMTKEFRPEFALDGRSKYAKAYKETLDRIMTSLELDEKLSFLEKGE
ncbi:MAG: hypothetical protein IJU76_04640 [Desulfovibrionaceae bacterium]|nr:hypothetical protein [Desulfovibrionaceae bacterium]